MNYSFRKKNKIVKYIIIHYTGMKTLKLAYQKFKYIDWLVNATFGSTSDKLSELTAEKFNKANQINLTGSFLLMRGVANKMKKGGINYSDLYQCISFFGTKEIEEIINDLEISEKNKDYFRNIFDEASKMKYSENIKNFECGSSF